MDSAVEFVHCDWDEIYEVPTLHLSYLLQTLLPVHVIKWSATRRHYDNINAKLKPSEDDVAKFVVTGSMAEGYSIPPSIYRKQTSTPPDVEVLSDVDTLWVSSQLLISTNEYLETEAPDYRAYFEYIKESPGYVRIRLPTKKAQDETFVCDELTGNYYLSGTRFTDKMFGVLSETDDVTRQGPAISMIDNLQMGDNFDFSVKGGISKDLVLALACSPWPRIAAGWGERVKNSEWLSANVVTSILNDGCHVVAVPSKNSFHPELEWRLSFSASEGKLAREAVTDYQRQCFIYVKILHHQKIKPKGILSSYMVKSVFLHCCEKIPVSYWREYPGSCILYILDVVLDCLKKKHIPTYFLPENNLIRHLNEDEIKQAMDHVEEVRRDPISPILEFTENRLFSHHCIYFTYREMVEPLLKDMQAFKDHKNKEKSVMEGVIPTGYRICHFLIAEESECQEAVLFKHQEGIRCLIDVYTLWLQPMNINATLAEFINKAGLALKDPHHCLVFFEAAVSLEHEYPALATLAEELACLYHERTCSGNLVSAKKKVFIAKAGQLFKRVYEENSTNIIHYAIYLLEQKQLSEARKIIEKFVEEITDETATLKYTFNVKDKDRLVEQLRHYIDVHGSISGDAVSFAFFFLVYCLCFIQPRDLLSKSATVMEKFESHCQKYQDDDNLRLLNLAKSVLENKQEPVSYFGFLYKRCSVM